MKVNVYDFDGTIYDGDSSVDFFKYCLKRKPKIIKILPKVLFNFLKWRLKIIDVTTFKEQIYTYLKYMDNIEELITSFWKKNRFKIKDFYLKKDHKNDIISSASPYFVLKPICKALGIKDLFASDVDKHTGRYNSPNNSCEQKVINLKERYPDVIVLEAYSDSMNDLPILELAQNAYVVKGNKIIPYNKKQKNFKQKLKNSYHKYNEMINYLIVGGLTTLISIGVYAFFSKVFGINNLANEKYLYITICQILSWICAVTFAYFANRIIVFKSRSKGKEKLKEFIKFISLRLISLLIETGPLLLLVGLFNMNDKLSKIIIQFIVIIANYVFSKLLVFRKRK